MDKPISFDFGEMICKDCMGKHTFLWKYSGLCVKPVQKDANESLNVSVSDAVENGCDESNKSNADVKVENEKPSESKKNEESCSLKSSNLDIGTGSAFWPEGWRKHLCQCADCLKMYESEKITFLLNETDTVQYYENKNKETTKETQYERGMKALSSLDRVKQVEAIEGKNFEHKAFLYQIQGINFDLISRL